MEITITHHVDASEPDADGKFDYRYEYDLFRFAVGDAALVVRSYVHEPDSAALLRMECAGIVSPVCENDLARPVTAEALRYLRSQGKRR